MRSSCGSWWQAKGDLEESAALRCTRGTVVLQTHSPWLGLMLPVRVWMEVCEITQPGSQGCRSPFDLTCARNLQNPASF